MFYIVSSLLIVTFILTYYIFPESPKKNDFETEVLGLGLLKTNYWSNNIKFSWYHKNGSIEDLYKYINAFEHNKFRRKVLFAELSGKYGKEDVTDTIKMAQGLKSDFHLSLNNSATTWDDILYEFDLADWNRLTIIDSLGKVHNINIDTDRKIIWNNEFKLD